MSHSVLFICASRGLVKHQFVNRGRICGNKSVHLCMFNDSHLGMCGYYRSWTKPGKKREYTNSELSLTRAAALCLIYARVAE